MREIKTFTILWPAHGENPLGLWLQKWSCPAETLMEAWNNCIEGTLGQDWAPQVGDWVMVISGEDHSHAWHRVIPMSPPLGLTEVHATGAKSDRLDRIGLKMRESSMPSSIDAATVRVRHISPATGLEIMTKALSDNMVDGKLLCRHCDIFVGFHAAGRAMPPAGKDNEWREDHCWICERSRDEIIAGYVEQLADNATPENLA